MPAGKPSQSNAMLFTVIIFVALFIISTSFAVIFYIKSGEYKAQADDAEREMDAFANRSEQSKIGSLVGKPLKGKSVLGTMVTYLDDMVEAVTGTGPEETTAAVKVNQANMKINEVLEPLKDRLTGATGPRGVDLVETVRQLTAELDALNLSARSTESQLNNVQDDFDLAVKNFSIEEQKLIEEKNRYQAEANRVQEDYDDLKKLMEESADEQIQIAMDKVERSDDKLLQRTTQLQAIQQELDDTKKELGLALNRLEDIKPRPDVDVPAFEPDARIVKIDMETNVVYLDIGSDDHVYRGLTFSVYDQSAPIPEDGKGKAEIEVFYVGRNVCGAQINSSSTKNAIVPEDIVVNLIWDSETSNTFVVAGDFDFDGNGRPEQNGFEKIEQLIERWGGRTVDDISIETDFMVAGTRPPTPPKPSVETLELDPDAGQKYDIAMQKVQDYDMLLRKARELNVPVFNRKRFMHMTGYDSLARRASPFSSPPPASVSAGGSY